ncbi:putative pentatricopeptide repeat protein [Diplodia seriata]|uniref:Putative pentatricopeptide repeat protein n=1 Tax=Diplodia seriata TaxID=420778 RepID=A0A0G2EZ02_9PEZI|nr:putative pentatricopeptide repeat protein [Diplodia seriata]
MRKSIVDPGHYELSPTVKRRLKMELEWTGGDPLRLADTVQKRLSKGDIEPVLDLVRFASNSMDCVVSWNHIIDHFMNLGRPSHALKIYNERPRDWDDILSLFEQTMDIPRLARHLGDDRKAPKWLPDTPRNMRKEDSAKIDPADHTRRGGEFDPVELGKTVGRGRRNMAYAKPGNHSLSLILESCLKTNARKAAEDYWHLLTGPDSWGIVPDEANLHMFLRILRQTRSSAAVVEFLRSEFGTRMGVKKPKTFRMAMSTCVRDKNNPNVFDHANVILDMMLTTLVDLDLRTLAMYTNLLTSLSRSEQIQSGLERLVPHLVNVKSMLNYGKNELGL